MKVWLLIASLAGSAAPAFAAADAPAPIISVQDVGRYLGRCMHEHGLSAGREGRDVTVRMSFRRDGSIIGEPRVTYLRKISDPDEQKRFVPSLLLALKACLPVPIQPGLGSAIAGDPLAIRFLYDPD